MPKRDFGTKRRCNSGRTVFMNGFYFFLLTPDIFWSFHVFLKKQKLKGKFPDNLGKSRLQNISRFNSISLHHKRNGTRLL